MADVVRMSIEVDARDVKKAERALDGVAREAEQAGRKTKIYSSQTKQASRETNRFSKVLTSARGAMTALSAGIAGITIGKFAQQIEQATTQLNNINATMRVATGDATEASQAIGFIREEAERLGLFFPAVAKQMAQFSAAARGTAITSSELKDIFTGISEASRAMGLTAPQAEGAMMALQQMMSKGKVSAEELRQQLGERMPGSIQIMAQALDVNTQKLFEMMENGELLSDEVLPKFGRELQRVFGSEAADQADRIAAAIGRLQTAFFDLMAQDNLTGAAEAINEIADAVSSEGFNKGFDAAIKLVSEFSAILGRNLDHIIQFTIALGGIGVARIATKLLSGLTGIMTTFFGILAPTTAGTVAFTGALQALQMRLALLAGPFGILAAGMALVFQWVESSEAAGEETKRWRQETERLEEAMGGLNSTQNKMTMDQAREASSNISGLREEISELEEEVAALEEQGIIPTTREEGRQLNRLRADLRTAEAAYESYILAQDNLDAQRANSLAETFNKENEARKENQEAREDALSAMAEIDPALKATRDLANGLEQVNQITEQLSLSKEEEARLLSMVREEYDSNIKSALGLGDALEDAVDAQKDFNDLLGSLDPKVGAAMEFAEGMRTVQQAVDEAGLSAEAASKATALLEEQFQDALSGKDSDAADELDNITSSLNNIIGRFDPISAAGQKFASDMKTVQEALDAGVISTSKAQEITEKLEEEYDKATRGARGLEGALQDIAESMTDDVSNGLTDIIMQAKDAEDVFASLARQIAKTIIQQQIANPIAEGITGFATDAIGTAFGAGGGGGGFQGVGNATPRQFANGGNVFSDTPAIVGERGPELFVPRQDGQIVPNHQMGGGGDVTVNIINQSGEKLEQQGQQSRRGPNGEHMVDVMVKSSIERLDGQGQLDGVFTRHGARRQGQF